MIRVWLCALYTIHAAFNKTAKCTSLHAPKYALKYTLDCTRWHTPSLLDCTLPSKLSRRSQLHSMAHSRPTWLCAPKWALKTLPIAFDDTLSACLTVRSQVSSQDAPNCTRWHTLSLLDCTLPSKLSRRSQLHSMAHSQPAWLYAPKWALKTLPIAHDDTLSACLTVHSQVSSQDALNCTRWHTPGLLDCTFPGTLSRRSQLHSMAHSLPAWLYARWSALKTLPIALDDTLPAFLTVRSQVSSQAALNHTPEHALKYTPKCTRWHSPSLLDYTLPSTLPRRSQVHSQEARHSRSHLTVYSNVCSCVLDPETC